MIDARRGLIRYLQVSPIVTAQIAARAPAMPDRDAVIDCLPGEIHAARFSDAVTAWQRNIAAAFGLPPLLIRRDT